MDARKFGYEVVNARPPIHTLHVSGCQMSHEILQSINQSTLFKHGKWLSKLVFGHAVEDHSYKTIQIIVMNFRGSMKWVPKVRQTVIIDRIL